MIKTKKLWEKLHSCVCVKMQKKLHWTHLRSSAQFTTPYTKKDPDAAEAYKDLIEKTFTDPECPVWNSVEK